VAKRIKAAEGADGTDPGEAPAEGAGAPRKRKPKTTVRQTYDFPFDLDFRVSGVAKSLRIPKTVFVLKLIEQGCAGYKVDKLLRSVWAETQGQDVSAA
jgi:hypothetical protein